MICSLKLRLFIRKTDKHKEVRIYHALNQICSIKILKLMTQTRLGLWISHIFTQERAGSMFQLFLDLFSRKIFVLSMGNSIDTELVLRSLYQAIIHRNPSSGLIVHYDRGCQYTSDEFKKVVKGAGFIQSMSAKGNCYDNAVMESFYHTLKTELVFFCDYKIRKEAIESIFEYIEVFYNRQRIHSTLGYMSPVEFENKDLQAQSRVKLARPAIEVN